MEGVSGGVGSERRRRKAALLGGAVVLPPLRLPQAQSVAESLPRRLPLDLWSRLEEDGELFSLVTEVLLES